LDTWHALGILLMLIPFVGGMALSARRVGRLSPRAVIRWPTPTGNRALDTGWLPLPLGALGTAAGGLTILWVGVTTTFVPQDLRFMMVSASDLREVSHRLIPLIAHDRVGFGGGVVTMGVTTALCAWFTRPSRHFTQAAALAGVISLSAAIGIHFLIGYTDPKHLLPAIVAAADLALALALMAPGLPRDT